MPYLPPPWQAGVRKAAPGAFTALYAAGNGVVGNGIADDTTALQTLLTIAATEGKTVVLEAGTTVMVDKLAVPSNTHLSMNGATIKKTAASADPALALTAVTNVLIENGTVDGHKAGWTPTEEHRHGVNIIGSSHVTIRDVVFYDNKGDGVYLGVSGGVSCSDVVLERVTCDANWRNALTIAGCDGLRCVASRFINTAGTSPQCGLDIEPNNSSTLIKNLRFVSCDFSGNALGGIEINGQAAVLSAQQSDYEFVGCTAQGNVDRGVGFAFGTDIRFIGGSIRENGIGVYFCSPNATTYPLRNITFTGVRIIGNTGSGVRLLTGFSDVSFVSCDISGNTTAGAAYGFDVAPTLASGPLTVAHCNLGGTTETHAFRSGSLLSSLTLLGNIYNAATSFSDDIASRLRLDHSYLNLPVVATWTAASSIPGVAMRTTGDSTNRVDLRTDGTVCWSSGSATMDVYLARTGVNNLKIGPDATATLKTGHAISASRPAAATVGKGAQFFDDTLSLPIWSTGSAWVNAAGTTV